MRKPASAVTGGWKISSPGPGAGHASLCVEALLQGVVWARFQGPLDTVARPDVTRQLFELLELPIVALNIDLSGVTFVDSSGIGLLIVASTQAELRSIELTLDQASPIVRLALERAGLTQRFNLRARAAGGHIQGPDMTTRTAGRAAMLTELMTPSEVGAFFGVGAKSVTRRARNGTLISV